MGPFFFCCLLCLTFVFANETLIFDTGAGGVPGHRLRAAKRGHELNTRDLKGCLSNEHQLHYVDGDSLGSTSQFAARVGMQLQAPALLLEDIEHHMENVDCFPTKIYLYFSSDEALQHAQAEFESVHSFLIITSHDGCNEDGERSPHLVSETAIHLHDHLIILTVSPVPWRSVFDTMTFDFGESDDDYVPCQQRELRPRQAAAASAASSSTSISYPAAPTASTPANVNVTYSFNSTYIDTAILPPDTSLSISGTGKPKTPLGLKVSCKNCTIQGSLDLVAGSFTVGNYNSSYNTNGIINETEAAFDYIENGYVEFRSNSFGAYIELETAVTTSTPLETYTAPFPDITIPGFGIPGLAALGPILTPQLSVGFKLSAGFDFTYGFQVTIPDNSYVLLDVANMTNSSQSGFDKAMIAALPFQAGMLDSSLTIVGGFNPQLLIGMDFLGGIGRLGAGIFLNVPTITTTLSTVSHVDNKCENITNSAAANKSPNGTFDTLTHVNASVDFAIGVIAEADLTVGKIKVQDAVPYTFTSKSFLLPTACLSFDSNAKTYLPLSATSSGSTKPTTSSAANLVRPLPKHNNSWRRVLVASGLLLVVSACLVLV